jgi:hypothetical protein
MHYFDKSNLGSGRTVLRRHHPISMPDAKIWVHGYKHTQKQNTHAHAKHPSKASLHLPSFCITSSQGHIFLSLYHFFTFAHGCILHICVREKVCGKDERREGGREGGRNAGMSQVRWTGETEGRSKGHMGKEERERERELAHACARGK